MDGTDGSARKRRGTGGDDGYYNLYFFAQSTTKKYSIRKKMQYLEENFSGI